MCEQKNKRYKNVTLFWVKTLERKKKVTFQSIKKPVKMDEHINKNHLLSTTCSRFLHAKILN